MENLVLGLYVLSLLACVTCLWLWWELEGMKDYVDHLRNRFAELGDRMEELEKRKR